jgi:hypothetical protein
VNLPFSQAQASHVNTGMSVPAEVVRWEWKRFRHAFVTVPVQVIRRAAQVWIRISSSHRFAEDYLAAVVSELTPNSGFCGRPQSEPRTERVFERSKRASPLPAERGAS